MIRGSRYGYGGTVNITGGTLAGSIFGTRHDTGNAYNNTVNISNATYNVDDNGIFGALGANAYNNVVNIYSGNFSTVSHPGLIIGGAIMDNGVAHDNTVNIEGGTFSGNIVAGSGNSNSEIYNNVLNIRGGNFSSGYLAAGSDTNVHDNSINISGSSDLSGVSLRGSYSNLGTNNTLNIYTKNLTAQNLYNFNSLNFYLDENISNGDTMLTLTDPAGTNLSGVAINEGVVSGNTNLKIGDTINLLTNSNGLITTSGTTYGTLTEGVSKNYEMSIEPSGNSIVANITKSPNTLNPETKVLSESVDKTTTGAITTSLDTPTISPNTLNPETKVLSESVDKTTTGAITTSLDTPTIENIIDIEPEINIVTNSVSKTTSRSTSTSMDTSKIENTGGNTENEEGSTTVQESANAMVVDSKGWEIFANMGGGSLRMKGSNGSHVDMTTQSINLGFARSLQSSAGKFTIAPIIDYVSGNYDSYLETGIHGNGKTRYIAGGLIARRMLPNGFYYEGSFRVGKVKTDFASDNIDKTGVFGRVTYDTSATTLAGHLKLGKAFRLNQNNFLDVYGIYYHAHQGSMEADLSSGEHYNFSSADAGRFRIGYRLTRRTSRISQIYTGLAYQYEHSTGVTATYKTYSNAGDGDKGSSGMFELGWIVKPLRALL